MENTLAANHSNTSISMRGGWLLAVSHCRGNRSKSNHWCYTKPTNYTSIGVSVGGGGTKHNWVATSDRLPPVIQQRWKSHRQLFCPDWGSSVWRTDAWCWMTGCFCIHPKWKTCGFNRNNKGGYSHHDQSVVTRGTVTCNGALLAPVGMSWRRCTASVMGVAELAASANL